MLNVYKIMINNNFNLYYAHQMFRFIKFKCPYWIGGGGVSWNTSRPQIERILLQDKILFVEIVPRGTWKICLNYGTCFNTESTLVPNP